MSKHNIGEKFIIEIAECSKGAESGNDIYRIKGFDTLTVNDKALKKLEAYTEKYDSYQDGYDEGHLVGYDKGISDMYKAMIWSAIHNDSSARDWGKKMKEDVRPVFLLGAYKNAVYEKKDIDKYLEKNLIEVGDEVRINHPTEIQRGIVTRIYTNWGTEYVSVLREDGGTEDFDIVDVVGTEYLESFEEDDSEVYDDDGYDGCDGYLDFFCFHVSAVLHLIIYMVCCVVVWGVSGHFFFHSAMASCVLIFCPSRNAMTNASGNLSAICRLSFTISL